MFVFEEISFNLTMAYKLGAMPFQIIQNGSSIQLKRAHPLKYLGTFVMLAFGGLNLFLCFFVPGYETGRFDLDIIFNKTGYSLLDLSNFGLSPTIGLTASVTYLVVFLSIMTRLEHLFSQVFLNINF